VNDIKPGDLVYVARDCCGEWIGMTFRVTRIGPVEALICGRCPACFGTVTGAWAESRSIFIAPLSWLQKIPPLWELDDVEHEEKVPA